MTLKNKVATVFGGTGFIGTQVVRELAKRGVTVKVATRVPERAYFLKPAGAVGQVVPFACNYGDDSSLAQAVSGSDYVVNCVGILYERGRMRRFNRIHTDLPEVIAQACKKAGVERFVHISALGCDTGTSKYAKSKLAGEKAVLKAYKTATILRPSVVFGEDDDFFNMFAHMARFVPVLPLIGGGETRFQPVFVGDVADAAMAALERPALGDSNPQGNIYELGGPDVLSFKEIYELLFDYTQRPRPLVKLPFWAAKIEAFFLQFLPKPLLTPDQVESLKTDTVVGKKALTLVDLGVNATALRSILPRYLPSYRAGGRFGKAGQSSTA
ncbi:MAG: complex I NDUFA9 subunit family protein [Alphaproteobacteria bacterium]|nr:complex I NDUFA9 subunit family protein [Alphaproteobacteria bacterium]